MSEIDNRGREYRYQADWQFAGEMYHVRCDNWDEFLEAKMNMESLFPQEKSVSRDPVDTFDKAVNTPPECPVHLTAMKFRQGVSKKTGKHYAFWSCGEKNEDGSWCNQKA